jgi:hypothetical protein
MRENSHLPPGLVARRFHVSRVLIHLSSGDRNEAIERGITRLSDAEPYMTEN